MIGVPGRVVAGVPVECHGAWGHGREGKPLLSKMSIPLAHVTRGLTMKLATTSRRETAANNVLPDHADRNSSAPYRG